MPVRIRIIAICLALMFLISAKAAFSIEEYLADYDQFWAELEASYPYLPVLEDRGCNLAALKAENRAAIEANVRDIAGFAAVLRDTMARMENLAHLSLVGPGTYDSYLDLIARGAFDADAPEIALFSDPQTRSSYGLLGAGGSTGDTGELPAVETSWYPEIRAACFRFRSFDHSLIERDRNIICEYLSAHPDAEHVIIDITGNSGGSDAYWAEVIVSPFGEAAQSTSYTFFRDTPLNRLYTQGADVLPISQMENLPDFVHELNLTHAVAHTVAFPLESYVGETLDIRPARWVLIDGGVYSAADGFAAFCKDSGWATLVGTPAMGDGADAFRPFIFRLENSGLLVRMSTSAAANEDGSLNALSGTRPDLLCKLRETPLQACLRIIQSQAA